MFDPSNMIFGAARPTGAEVQALIFPEENRVIKGGDVLDFLSKRFDSQAFKMPTKDKEAKKVRVVDGMLLPRPPSWPVRNQTPQRGTCTAFNFVAAMEMMLATSDRDGPVPHLSEEYLYSKMRREFAFLGPDEDGTGTTFLEQALEAASAWGTCPRNTLPYQGHKPEPAWSVRDTRPFDSGAIPFKIKPKRVFCWRKGKDFSKPMSLPPERLRETVRLVGVPICISLPIYKHGRITDWTYGAGWDTGIIPEPPIDAAGHRPEIDGGHSVCIVGHIIDTRAPGGGWYVFRNSWGRYFGARKADDPQLAPFLEPGYGLLSEKHVHEHAWELVWWEI